MNVMDSAGTLRQDNSRRNRVLERILGARDTEAINRLRPGVPYQPKSGGVSEASLVLLLERKRRLERRQRQQDLEEVLYEINKQSVEAEAIAKEKRLCDVLPPPAQIQRALQRGAQEWMALQYESADTLLNATAELIQESRDQARLAAIAEYEREIFEEGEALRLEEAHEVHRLMASASRGTESSSLSGHPVSVNGLLSSSSEAGLPPRSQRENHGSDENGFPLPPKGPSPFPISDWNEGHDVMSLPHDGGRTGDAMAFDPIAMHRDYLRKMHLEQMVIQRIPEWDSSVNPTKPLPEIYTRTRDEMNPSNQMIPGETVVPLPHVEDVLRAIKSHGVAAANPKTATSQTVCALFTYGEPQVRSQRLHLVGDVLSRVTEPQKPKSYRSILEEKIASGEIDLQDSDIRHAIDELYGVRAKAGGKVASRKAKRQPFAERSESAPLAASSNCVAIAGRPLSAGDSNERCDLPCAPLPASTATKHQQRRAGGKHLKGTSPKSHADDDIPGDIEAASSASRTLVEGDRIRPNLVRSVDSTVDGVHEHTESNAKTKPAIRLQGNMEAASNPDKAKAAKGGAAAKAAPNTDSAAAVDPTPSTDKAKAAKGGAAAKAAPNTDSAAAVDPTPSTDKAKAAKGGAAAKAAPNTDSTVDPSPMKKSASPSPGLSQGAGKKVDDDVTSQLTGLADSVQQLPASADTKMEVSKDQSGVSLQSNNATPAGQAHCDEPSTLQQILAIVPSPQKTVPPDDGPSIHDDRIVDYEPMSDPATREGSSQRPCANDNDEVYDDSFDDSKGPSPTNTIESSAQLDGVVNPSAAISPKAAAQVASPNDDDGYGDDFDSPPRDDKRFDDIGKPGEEDYSSDEGEGPQDVVASPLETQSLVSSSSTPPAPILASSISKEPSASQIAADEAEGDAYANALSAALKKLKGKSEVREAPAVVLPPPADYLESLPPPSGATSRSVSAEPQQRPDSKHRKFSRGSTDSRPQYTARDFFRDDGGGQDEVQFNRPTSRASTDNRGRGSAVQTPVSDWGEKRSSLGDGDHQYDDEEFIDEPASKKRSGKHRKKAKEDNPPAVADGFEEIDIGLGTKKSNKPKKKSSSDVRRESRNNHDVSDYSKRESGRRSNNGMGFDL